VAVLVMVEIPGAGIEQYEQVSKALGLRDPNAEAPEGLIWHVAGEADGVLTIVDAWESPEAFERLMERAAPEIAKTGAPAAQPRVLPLHNHIPQGKGTRPNVIAIIEAEGFGPDAYDAVISGMPAHEGDGSNHPAVSHAAAVNDEGMVFVDVWDSPESLGRFAEEQIGPAAAESGLGSLDPRFVPVHNRMVGKVHASA
jgi:hypothetical protein